MKKYIDYLYLRAKLIELEAETLERYLSDKSLTNEQLEGKYCALQDIKRIIDEMAEINDMCVIGEER